MCKLFNWHILSSWWMLTAILKYIHVYVMLYRYEREQCQTLWGWEINMSGKFYLIFTISKRSYNRW